MGNSDRERRLYSLCGFTNTFTYIFQQGLEGHPLSQDKYYTLSILILRPIFSSCCPYRVSATQETLRTHAPWNNMLLVLLRLFLERPASLVYDSGWIGEGRSKASNLWPFLFNLCPWSPFASSLLHEGHTAFVESTGKLNSGHRPALALQRRT